MKRKYTKEGPLVGERLHTDITVVGTGIAGLWAAKELVDQGHSVTIVEKSRTLADGATTRNEGWLHAGTYHAVAVEDTSEIQEVVANTRFGHQEIVGFASEAIDHAGTYAVASDDQLAHHAVARWTAAGVPFKEIDVTRLAEEGLDSKRLRAAFEVQDKSINSRVLCHKLAEYISAKGGTFLLEADFTPEDEHTALVTQGEDRYALHSERFLITAGAGIKRIVEQVRGTPLQMRFFKAHLQVAPRLTEHNYFHLEPGEAGFMNHGSASVIGINRDGLELGEADCTVDPEKERLIHDAITRMVPHAAQYGPQDRQFLTIACNKPDVRTGIGDTQSLGAHVFRASPNYLCALPGKMTTAPYLGKMVADLLTSEMGIHIPAQTRTKAGESHEVTSRPLDRLRTVSQPRV